MLTPLTSCALHWSEEREPAWAIVSLKKKEMAFFDIGLEWSFGETNSDLGRGVTVLDLCMYILRALTGQSNETSSSVSSFPNLRDFKTKDLGIGFLTVSVLATNSGKYDRMTLHCERI